MGCVMFLFLPNININILGLTCLVGFGRFIGSWISIYSSETMDAEFLNISTSFNFLIAALSS